MYTGTCVCNLDPNFASNNDQQGTFVRIYTNVIKPKFLKYRNSIYLHHFNKYHLINSYYKKVI
jgi:hypothetical protein